MSDPESPRLATPANVQDRLGAKREGTPPPKAPDILKRTTDWFLGHWPLKHFTAYADGLLRKSWRILAMFAAGSLLVPSLYFIAFDRSASPWAIGVVLGIFALIGWFVPAMGAALVKRAVVFAAQVLTVVTFGAMIVASVWLSQMLLRAMGVIS